MKSIDEKTSIPLQWVVTGAMTCGSAILAAVVVACMWIFTVNARLARIEQKLGIEQPVAGSGFIHEAEASGK